MRQMSERAAWLALARTWDKAKPAEWGEYCVKEGDEAFGLCLSLWFMLRKQAIGSICYAQMKYRLEKRVGPQGGFAWPTTARGARARAAWCRKQAALLSKKG